MLARLLRFVFAPWKAYLFWQLRRQLTAARAEAAVASPLPEMTSAGSPPVRLTKSPSARQRADFMQWRTPTYVPLMSDGVADALAAGLLNRDRPAPLNAQIVNMLMLTTPAAYMLRRDGEDWVADFTSFVEAFVAEMDPLIEDGDWQELAAYVERGLPGFSNVPRVDALAQFILQVSVVHTSDHLTFAPMGLRYGFHFAPARIEKRFTWESVGRWDRWRTRNMFAIFINYNANPALKHSLLDIENYGFAAGSPAQKASERFKKSLIEVDRELYATASDLDAERTMRFELSTERCGRDGCASFWRPTSSPSSTDEEPLHCGATREDHEVEHGERDEDEEQRLKQVDHGRNLRWRRSATMSMAPSADCPFAFEYAE